MCNNFFLRLYGAEIRAKEILSGSVPPPDEAAPLYKALEKQAERVALEVEMSGGGGVTPPTKRAESKSGISMSSV